MLASGLMTMSWLYFPPRAAWAAGLPSLCPSHILPALERPSTGQTRLVQGNYPHGLWGIAGLMILPVSAQHILYWHKHALLHVCYSAGLPQRTCITPTVAGGWCYFFSLLCF